MNAIDRRDQGVSFNDFLWRGRRVWAFVREANQISFDPEDIAHAYSRYQTIYDVRPVISPQEEIAQTLERYSASIIATPLEIRDATQKIAMIGFDAKQPLSLGDAYAALKWMALKQSFVESGIDVFDHTTLVESGDVYHDPEAIWVRDAGFVIDDTVYMPDPRALSYNLGDVRALLQKRIAFTKKFFEKLGLRTVVLEGLSFDGGNIVPHIEAKKIFWGREGFEVPLIWREALRKAVLNNQGLAVDVVPIVTCNKNFHIDLAMSDPLPDNSCLVKKDWSGAARVRAELGSQNMRWLLAADDCTANLVCAGSTLFMPTCDQDLRSDFGRDGFQVNAPDGGDKDRNLRKIGGATGGSVRCMTQAYRLH